MKNRLKNIYRKIIALLELFFLTNLLLSKFYYFFLSNKFDKEIKSVIEGKKKYNKNYKNLNNKTLLIRNVHKIEKGLSMLNRRKLFALDFIEETVITFSNLWKTNKDDEQFIWFKDVLQMYFSVVDKENVLIKKLSPIFLNTIESDMIQSDKIPYQRNKITKSSISYEELLVLNHQRTSVRWYKEQEVNLDMVDKAIILASESPSACNRQPYEYIIINDKELLPKISKLPMGTAGYAENIPLMVAIVGNQSAYFDERDRHVIYIDGSLSAMNFILALETLGLSSCVINWPDIPYREKKAAKLLNLNDSQRIIMFISVGYALEEGYVPYSCKKNINEIRKIK